MAETIGHAEVIVTADGKSIPGDLERDFNGTQRVAERAGDRDGKAYVRRFESAFGRFAQRLENRFSLVGQRLGRLFGKGARNNFLNLFGRAVEGVIVLSGKLLGFIGKIVDGFVNAAKTMGVFFSTLFKRTDKAETAMEEFALAVTTAFGEGAMATIATGGLNLVAGLVAIAGAMGLVIATGGALVSLLLALGGIIIALASSITFALGGALLLVGPLLVTTAAAIGGVILAVDHLKNASGPLKTAMDGVKDTASELKDVFADAAFKNAPDVVDRINEVMKESKPLVRAVGNGFRRMVNEFLEVTENPAWTEFRETWKKFLPDAMAKLGTITGNLTGAFAGVFTAATPKAQEFLDWLVRITEKFEKWATSDKGQKEIQDFLDRAAESAKSLGGFLESAIGLIESLFTPSKDTGDTLLDRMSEKMDEWAEWLDTHGAEVQQFFADAEETASELGAAIERIGEAVDELDTERNRDFANKLIQAFTLAIGVITSMIRAYDLLLGAATAVPRLIIAAFSAMVAPMARFALNIIQPMFKAFQGIMTAAFNAVEAVLGAMSHLPGGAGDAASGALAAFREFRAGAEGEMADVEAAIADMKAAAEGTMTLRVDNSQALSAISAAQRAALNLFDLMRRAPTVRSPRAVEEGVTPGSAPSGTTTSDDTRPPTTRRTAPGVTINVTTPTTDTVGVANETVNRLVGLGYAS